jgi:hypothetical protein
MLQLFQSIFARDTGSAPYPEDLITRALARAIDATDPRLRVVSGHARKLRPAVSHAIDQVVRLVDSLPQAIELTGSNYGGEPRLVALFVSVDHMRDVLIQDSELREFRRQAQTSAPERAYALLMMQKREKKVLGMELHGDVVQREVAQVSVNFTDHRLVDAAAEQSETRRLLVRRAFDHLLTVALARMTREQDLRETLKRQRRLLQRKLDLLKVGRWSFDVDAGEQPVDPAVIEVKLAKVEAQLNALAPDSTALKDHLAILADVLNAAETQLWTTPAPVIVDRMGIAHEHAMDGDLVFELDALHSADGRTLYLLPVCVLLPELPPPIDLYAEAGRYLR